MSRMAMGNAYYRMGARRDISRNSRPRSFVRVLMKSLLLLLCCACGFAADFSGPWTGTLSGPIYLILKQDGTKLSGSGGSSAKDQFVTFDNGRVEGGHAIFKVG